MPSRAELAKISLLFGLSCLLWLGIAVSCGNVIATGLLPLLRWEIAQLGPQYDVTDLSAARAGGETVVIVRVSTAYSRVASGVSVPSNVRMHSATLLGHLFQPLVVLCSLVSTAALLRRHQAVLLLLLAMLAAVAVVMLDVPFVLVGALEDLAFSAGPPSNASWSPWVTWMNLLNGGGRLALGLGAALVVIGLGARLTASADQRAGLGRRVARFSKERS
jgi:hypothetical protein